ncbi:MAG: hypothetical protein GTO46_02050 [Gemmatimonadetes bacterium]|nr:hypothetical protein [Gemmatimonadota bacterium]NIO30580.1 hypothetical protein [Gemmatimonadota bacterium]
MIAPTLPWKRRLVGPTQTVARRKGWRCVVLLAVLPVVLSTPPDCLGQQQNIFLPVDSIEHLFRYGEMRVLQIRDTRFEGDRTQMAVLAFPETMALRVKWAAAPRGADSFNNRPRFEIAVYELQKLFLDEEDYVVPPTVVRAVTLAEYPMKDEVRTTFRGIESVVVLMQYWLSNVTSQDVYDKDRAKDDSLYARHLANLNILTYLVRHADANPGNFLISTAGNARVFAVDNGVSFGDISDRPDDWRKMRTDRLPQATVERLRGISEEDLHQALGVLAQFEVRDELLVQVEPTENLNPGRGVRREDDVVQFGLTTREIGRVHGRLQDLLEDIDEDKYEIF